MKISLFTTATNPIERMDPYDEAMACYTDFADEIIVGGKDWPHEFDWPYIGETFQKTYEQCTGDWVIRMDLDYLFHEDDLSKIRAELEQAPDNIPGLCFYKYQFLLVDGYQIKSRPVIAVNRKAYGDRIKFDGGGDLCQPTLDGTVLTPDNMPEIRVPIYNYDFTFKTKEVIQSDFPRFSRAWGNHFGKWNIGGPDDESSWSYFQRMMTGRFHSRGREHIKLKDHPKYIQDRIANMTPEHFGHSMFGWVNETADYFKEAK